MNQINNGVIRLEDGDRWGNPNLPRNDRSIGSYA